MPLHTDQQSALLIGASRPFSYKIVDGFPAAQIEIANSEIRMRAVGEGLSQGWEKFEFDVVENTRHAPPFLLLRCSGSWRTIASQPFGDGLSDQRARGDPPADRHHLDLLDEL